jgi:DNA topoisomerase-2
VVDSSGKKVKRKKATLKTRKSIGSGKRLSGGGGDLDGNDDFMLTKKATAAKVRKPVAPAGGASRARPKPKESDDEIGFGEDGETLPPPTKKRAAPAAPATKPPPPSHKAKSGSDIKMADDGLPPPRPKNASLSTAKDEDEAEDSGDDLVRQALEKGKGKATATQTGKRKS